MYKGCSFISFGNFPAGLPLIKNSPFKRTCKVNLCLEVLLVKVASYQLENSLELDIFDQLVIVPFEKIFKIEVPE